MARIIVQCRRSARLTAVQPLPPSLAHLVDRQEILDCLQRYARGLDRLDEPLIRSAFHADAMDQHGPVNGSVDDFLAYWLPMQAAREVSQHHITNHTVEIHGDVAHAETYFLYFGKQFGDPVMRVSGGRYVDRFERRDGCWRIAFRVVISEWQMHADGEPTELLRAQLARGRRDASDPSYQRPLAGVPHAS
jgi:hypothetical protein